MGDGSALHFGVVSAHFVVACFDIHRKLLTWFSIQWICGVARHGKDERGGADHRSQIPDDPVGDLLMDGKAGAVFLQFFLQAVFDVQQTVQEERVEEAAFPVEDHPDGFFVSESVLVDALACQGIVDVSEGYDLRRDRDGIALEAVGVSATVPALVMPAADGVSHLDKGALPERLPDVRPSSRRSGCAFS